MDRKHMYSVGRPLRIIDKIGSDKPRLFIVISIIVVSALAVPIIIPHINHPQHLYHVILHIASLILSLFLFIVSISSYIRNGGSRLLFMSLGFLSLVIVETLFLFYAMLTLFGIGVLKVNTK